MKKLTRLLVIAILLFSSIAMTACNLPASSGVPTDIQGQQTVVAQTVAAMQTEMSQNPTPEAPAIATSTPQPAADTPTPTATVPLYTPTATFTPQPTFRISKVVDVTYPDNTVVKPNTAFTKTWRLTNGGTGTWTADFKLVFVSGTAMGAPASKPLGRAVPPGSSIEISVEMTAPAAANTYTGNWMLQTANGSNFGLGESANSVFWVKVKVDVNMAVTAASVSAVADAASCATKVTLTASVTANTSGKITYYFITSQGNSSQAELSFEANGTKTTAAVDIPLSFGASTSITFTYSLYNDYPNHQEFGAGSLVLTCP